MLRIRCEKLLVAAPDSSGWGRSGTAGSSIDFNIGPAVIHSPVSIRGAPLASSGVSTVLFCKSRALSRRRATVDGAILVWKANAIIVGSTFTIE